MDWLNLWQTKATAPDFLTQTGRGNSFDFAKFLLYMTDVNNALQLTKTDNLLDIGGATGYITLWLSAFVNSVTMFDYSNKMIDKAIELTTGCPNVTVFQDDILTMAKVQRTFNKVLVGSILQYLANMDEVRIALQNIYNVMSPGGRCLLTHNPDASKKESHIASMPQTEESLRQENERLWIDPSEMWSLTREVGFESYRPHINPLIWQSTHMFDILVTK
jgi:protein-L-isoaspartate O-methyltransferase